MQRAPWRIHYSRLATNVTWLRVQLCSKLVREKIILVLAIKPCFKYVAKSGYNGFPTWMI